MVPVRRGAQTPSSWRHHDLRCRRILDVVTPASLLRSHGATFSFAVALLAGACGDDASPTEPGGGGGTATTDAATAIAVGPSVGSGLMTTAVTSSGSGGKEVPACPEPLAVLDDSGVNLEQTVGEHLFFSRFIPGTPEGDGSTIERLSPDGEITLLETGLQLEATASNGSDFFWLEYSGGARVLHRIEDGARESTEIAAFDDVEVIAAGASYAFLGSWKPASVSLAVIPIEGGDAVLLGTVNEVVRPGPMVAIGDELLWAIDDEDARMRILHADARAPGSLAPVFQGDGLVNEFVANDTSAFGLVIDSGTLSLWRFELDGTATPLDPVPGADHLVATDDALFWIEDQGVVRASLDGRDRATIFDCQRGSYLGKSPTGLFLDTYGGDPYAIRAFALPLE